MKLKMHTKPWKHQLQGLKYFMKNDSGALYTDMGSGKSKILIDTIVNRGFKNVLIVAPVRVCDSWVDQFYIHAPNENMIIRNLTETKGTTEKLSQAKLSFNKKDKSNTVKILVVNYESVWRQPLKNFLAKANIDAIICDEAHKIKSPSSKCSGMLTMLGRRTKHRYLVTGTPLSQSPLDIYAQYRFLDPSIFGTNYNNFKEEYANFEKHNGGYPVLNKKNPYKNLDVLEEKMFSVAFCVPVVDNLPETQDIEVNFTLSDKAQKAYDKMNREGALILKDGFVTSSNVLSKILRLQQLTSGYLPVENDDGEVKLVQGDKSRLQAVKDIVDEIHEEEPIVIFCRYKQDVKNVRQAMSELGRSVSELSGKMNTMKDWDAGKTTVLIVQIQSGAEGLNNLVKSRYCIYYSLHPSLTLWKQSRKRQHRHGQDRGVIYYTIIAKMGKGKTIDELMYESLKKNEYIVDAIMARGMI